MYGDVADDKMAPLLALQSRLFACFAGYSEMQKAIMVLQVMMHLEDKGVGVGAVMGVAAEAAVTATKRVSHPSAVFCTIVSCFMLLMFCCLL